MDDLLGPGLVFGGRQEAQRQRQEARAPVRDDLCAVNRQAWRDPARVQGRPTDDWLSDITKHRAGESMLYVCAIKDVYSNRIVGLSIDSRMKSSLAVAALNNAAARRRIEGADVAGCVIHTDRGSEGAPPRHAHGRDPCRLTDGSEGA